MKRVLIALACLAWFTPAYAQTCMGSLPFTMALANKGYAKACRDNPHLLAGLNIHRGALTYEAVASAQKREYTPPERALGPA